MWTRCRYTPLLRVGGHSEVVSMLAKEGVDVNQARDDGYNHFSLRVKGATGGGVDAAGQGGRRCEPGRDDGATPLFIASQGGRCGGVMLLAKEGVGGPGQGYRYHATFHCE